MTRIQSFPLIVFSFLLFSILCVFSADDAQARKFDYNDGVFSVYVGGTIGTSRIQKTPFEPGMPSTVSFPDYNGVNYGYSGLFGFDLTLQNRVSFKLGVDFLYAAEAKDIEGKNSSGNVLLSETSDTLGVVPEFMVELHLARGPRSRVSVGGGVGYMTATIRNDIRMTALGQSTLGVSNYVEEGQGTAIPAKLFTNFEFILVDNVSMVLQAGYRYAVVKQFNYTRNATAPAPIGAEVQGQVMKNADGTNRTVDMSGVFGGVQLIFWMW